MRCARGCTLWRRHSTEDGAQPWLAEDQEPCPVKNGQTGAWVGVTVDDPVVGPSKAEWLRSLDEDELQLRGYGLGRYGQLQQWHECGGCAPREATHGVLCTQCHTKLSSWLHGARSLAWCWYWLAGDLEPGQSGMGGDKVKASRTPPAAMSIAVFDLRQDLLAALGGWLATVCAEFRLEGPGWFRHRLDEERRRQGARSRDLRAPWAEMDWRAWLPQDAPTSADSGITEIEEACRYLAGWLDRICGVEDLAVSMYDQARRLHGQVKRVAPWEPKATRMQGLQCPKCGRDALVRFEGDEHLTCRRCDELVPRQRYDVWSAGLEHEREAS